MRSPWMLSLSILGVGLASAFIARRARASEGKGNEVEPDAEDADAGTPPPPGKRVKVADYAALKKADPRLVALPHGYGTKAGLRVHKAILTPLVDLIDAARKAGHVLGVSSAWREHRWASRADYEATLRKLYGPQGTIRQFPEDRFLAEGRKLLGYDSPHETGLTVDFRSGSDLLADSRTIATQRKSAVYQWLVEHAGEYGAVPYAVEPWHWEWPIDRAVFDEK